MSPTDPERAAAKDLIAYVDASPTPWHAVSETARRLDGIGFRRLDEADEWTLERGDRRYCIRGGSIAAFVVGADPLVQAGFRMVAAHTDSPNLRIKPQPDVTSERARQLGVEPYGGVLLSTWIDRDLGLAGRVVLADGTAPLIDLRRPICRIPNLAIHLNRAVNTDGLVLNPQRHLAPIWALEEGSEIRSLRELVAAELRGPQMDDILATDLCLFETHGGVLAGPAEELLLSARLDNLASCHAAITALSAAAARGCAATGLAVLYDHEEIGSRSAQGAASTYLRSIVARIATATGGGAHALERAMARSWLVSSDMAHAVHPNYADLHEPQHKPRLGGGPTLKTHQGQAYATQADGAARFTALCRRAGHEPQHFVSRSDLPCGSTVGPITAAELGVQTVDVGNPMLSMHSCREMAATRDVRTMIEVLTGFLE